MRATQKQIELCNLLIDNGAPFDIKMSHEESIQSADKFIKSNQKYFKVVGYYDFAGKGNVHPNYWEKVEKDMIDNPDNWHPSDFGVYNM